MIRNRSLVSLNLPMYPNFHLAFCLKLRDSNRRHKSTIEILRVNQLSQHCSSVNLHIVVDFGEANALNWHFVKPLLSQSLRIGDCLSKWVRQTGLDFLSVRDVLSKCVVLWLPKSQQKITPPRWSKRSNTPPKDLGDSLSCNDVFRVSCCVFCVWNVVFLEVPCSSGLGTCHSHGATWPNGKGWMSCEGRMKCADWLIWVGDTKFSLRNHLEIWKPSERLVITDILQLQYMIYDSMTIYHNISISISQKSPVSRVSLRRGFQMSHKKCCTKDINQVESKAHPCRKSVLQGFRHDNPISSDVQC